MVNIINSMTSTASSATTANSFNNLNTGIGTFSSYNTNYSSGNPRGFLNVDSNQIKHEGQKLDLYLNAIIILLNQKGIKISEDEIKEAIDSIKIMDKLVGE